MNGGAIELFSPAADVATPGQFAGHRRRAVLQQIYTNCVCARKGLRRAVCGPDPAELGGATALQLSATPAVMSASSGEPRIASWIATQYAAVRTWLFGWLPFHIPPEWHDPIVLFLTVVSVTNVGLYRKTKRTIIFHIFNRDVGLVVWGLSLFAAIWFAVAFAIAKVFSLSMFYSITIFLTFALGAVTSKIITLTWHWLLTTAVIFGALVAVNQVYVLWLEPLAEHH